MGGVRTGDPQDYDADAEEKVLRIWDPLVRIFHWSAVTLVAVAFLTEDDHSLHRSFGYVLMSILAVRVLWGLIGSRHARFADFVPSPGGLVAYLRDVAAGRERRYLGHNPAGGAMVLALMSVIAALGFTGWLMGVHGYRGEEWLEELHETLANGLLVLVALHLAGVILASRRHGENLVKAMLTGRKRV